ncbi:DoxX family protein [Nonomuraea angiospora]|uniref:Oxidoreductase n=1 Tax=Nonomuraea angiospora TaxID=46172 RepID=A0ABR9M6W2_9ACTN|nr:DoxX family protein [Nonomuraea angiospora]MBE1588646.1 putative oxidoreductase [Nonomuraea angiospora]
MKRVVFDVATLIARLVTGVVLVAHGSQKWQGGLAATGQAFKGMGIPMPELAAAFATVVETAGGIFLILGLLVRLVGLLLLINMLGAITYVHAGHGVLSSAGGWELPGALGALGLLFLALGGGRIGIDGIFAAMFRRRSARRAAEEEHAAQPQRPEPSNVTTRPAGPATPATSAEAPRVPRQPTEHRAGGVNDDDMRDIDALVSDEPPPHRKPPNRSDAV